MQAQPCPCTAYPFPHREGGGKCRGEGVCDMCGAGTDIHGDYGANWSYQWAECPECGWSNK